MTGPKALAQYAQVREKVDGGLAVAAAVKAVAEETGASPGTLQSVYYRVAREKGVTAPRKTRNSASATRRSAPGKARRGRSPRASAVGGAELSTAELLRQLAETATALSMRVEALERDSRKLRDVEAAFTQ